MIVWKIGHGEQGLLHPNKKWAIFPSRKNSLKHKGCPYFIFLTPVILFLPHKKNTTDLGILKACTISVTDLTTLQGTSQYQIQSFFTKWPKYDMIG